MADRAALLAGVAVLMSEAEQLNDLARCARAILAKRMVLEVHAIPMREQAAADEAKSCRLAGAAGWMQAEANRIGTVSEGEPVTHGNAHG